MEGQKRSGLRGEGEGGGRGRIERGWCGMNKTEVGAGGGQRINSS